MTVMRLIAIAVFITCLSSIAFNADAVHYHGEESYVCPPCGCGADDVASDKPGSCQACGMALVAKSSLNAQPEQQPAAQPQPELKKVAILIFNGVQIIDYTGPYEVFGQAGFDTFTVAEKVEPIRTAMGMIVTPRYTLDASPQPDIIVLPGGDIQPALTSPRVIKWIQDREKQAQFVLSVCNGSFILAKTGLLDGLSTTTFYGLIDDLKVFAPKTKVLSDRRYVDNGKFISTAGISSGIDGSLYVVSKFYGLGRAQMAALNMEYNWSPDSSYARAAFADRHIRKVFGRGLNASGPGVIAFKVLRTQGGKEDWEVNWEWQSEESGADLLKMLNRKLTDGKWVMQNGATTTSAWKFSDEDGAPWQGKAEVKPASKGKYTASLRIARTGGK
jgi:putative intracellular protease/amidase